MSVAKSKCAKKIDKNSTVAKVITRKEALDQAATSMSLNLGVYTMKHTLGLKALVLVSPATFNIRVLGAKLAYSLTNCGKIENDEKKRKWIKKCKQTVKAWGKVNKQFDV